MDLANPLKIEPNGNAYPIELGADMSASSQCARVLDIREAKTIRILLMWPTSTGAARPTGKFYAKISATPVVAAFGLIEQFANETAWAKVLALQPSGNGAAGKIDLFDIPVTGGFLECGYTATSGGADVVPQCFVTAVK